MKRAFGCLPDRPDDRDRPYVAPGGFGLPSSLRQNTSPFMPPVYNQFLFGSCTGNGVARLMQWMLRKEGLADFMPSRLALYGLARRLEGTLLEDAGAEIRDVMKVAAADGVLPESEWIYSPAHLYTVPDNKLLHEAKLRRATEYLRLTTDDDLYHIRHCLAEGYLVTFGIPVFDNFPDETTTGYIPMPGKDTGEGHCMVFDGYDHAARKLFGPNSWGAGWGNAGYFEIDYDYILEQASDIWTVKKI